MTHWRATRDTCRHGHPFPANLRIDKRGWAYCTACWRNTYVPATPDPAAIERATAGDPPARLTPRERTAAIHHLDTYGLSARQIADRIGCSKRTVHRVRSRKTTA